MLKVKLLKLLINDNLKSLKYIHSEYRGRLLRLLITIVLAGRS